MKGLAFAYDPDGYWIEVVKRNKDAGHPETYNLGQTMLRIKDVDKSLDFYTGEGGMGMTKVSKRPYTCTVARTGVPEYWLKLPLFLAGSTIGSPWYHIVSAFCGGGYSTHWTDQITSSSYGRSIRSRW